MTENLLVLWTFTEDGKWLIFFLSYGLEMDGWMSIEMDKITVGIVGIQYIYIRYRLYQTHYLLV